MRARRGIVDWYSVEARSNGIKSVFGNNRVYSFSMELRDNEDICVKEELRKKSLKSFLKFLLQRSSINGVSRIGTEANWIHRGIWSAVLILGIIGCSIQCHHFLSSYFAYPVVVNLDVQNSWNAEFPAVTVCNLNRVTVRRMRLECNEAAMDCGKPIPQACYGFFNWTNMCFIGYSSGLPMHSPTRNQGIPQTGLKQRITCKQLRNRDVSQGKRKELTFLSNYAKLPEDFRARVGHQFEDLIHRCTFNGEPCNIANFTVHPPSLTLGNCFTFNGKGSNISTPAYTQSVGIESGLLLELNFETDDYLDLTEDVGARISVHDFASTPIAAEDGFNVAPGFDVLIGLKKTTVRRLPPPYKDKCFNYSHIQSDTMEDASQESCFRTCFQNHTRRICNCSNPFLKIAMLDDVRVCDLNLEDDVCCLESVEEYFKNTTDETICHCPLPCEKHYYDTTFSFSEWPSEKYFEKMLQENLSLDILNLTQNSKPSEKPKPEDLKMDRFRKNRAKVRIFYRTLEKTVYKQIPMYQDSEVFSQMGGQLGLWLGVSLIALFECLESAVLLVHFAIRRKTEDSNKP